MQELPRDIQKKIIRIMDIDTRRLVGVYRKIIIPALIREKLNKHIKSLATSVVFDIHEDGGYVAYKFVGLNDIVLKKHWHNQDIEPKYMITKEVLANSYRYIIRSCGTNNQNILF